MVSELNGSRADLGELTHSRDEAVRLALQDAQRKGKLDIAALMHGIPAAKLQRYAEGDDSALTEFELEWLAVDLRVQK